jgi:hypothetical protein
MIYPSIQTLTQDTGHWHHLRPPLSPNAEEVTIYLQQIRGFQPVYLLGMTRELLPCCDVAVDLNPVECGKPTLKRDWKNLDDIQAGAIIGDGVLNLAGIGLVDTLLRCCDRLVCRVFLKKLPGMKYAAHFPQEFPAASLVIPTQEHIVMVVWDQHRI